MSDIKRELIDQYHQILEKDEQVGLSLFERLKKGMAALRLLYGDRELGVSLRPHFLTREEYHRLARDSEVLAGAFTKMAEMIIERPELMDDLGLTEREKRLAKIDPGFKSPAVNTRLDAFIYRDRVKYVEYNAENPSSLTDQSGLNRVLFEVGAMQVIAEKYRLHQPSPLNSLLKSLMDTFHEWGGKGIPNVAILDWANLPTRHEFILLRNFLVGSGVPAIICTPDELEYSGDGLRRRDFKIDLVYKRVIIRELLDRFSDDHPLIRAYINGNVCLINPFRCKILHKKSSFELVAGERLARRLSNDEIEVIESSIPWTRRLSDRATGYKGRMVDLLEFVRLNRDILVLKPNDDYGGQGVFFGNDISESEWDRAIDSAIENDYVVQEKIELVTEDFPIFNDQDWGIQKMYVDTNPFIFNGKVDGVMVRLSDSPVVNVTTGGGETGFFIIEGRV